MPPTMSPRRDTRKLDEAKLTQAMAYPIGLQGSAEEACAVYSAKLRAACDKAIPKKGTTRKGRAAYWWSEQFAEA